MHLFWATPLQNFLFLLFHSFVLTFSVAPLLRVIQKGFNNV